MAGPKGPELGTKSPYRIRVGIEVQALRGVSKEGDSASGPPDTFQELINVDPSGGMWIDRPGLARENASQIETNGCVELIHELSDVGAPVESAFGPCIILLETTRPGESAAPGDPSKVYVFADSLSPKLKTFTLSEIPATNTAYLSAVYSQAAQAIVAGSGYDNASQSSMLVRITASDPPTAVVEQAIAGAGSDFEHGVTGLAADGAASPTLVHASVGVNYISSTDMVSVSWDPTAAETAPVTVDDAMGAPGGDVVIGYHGSEIVEAFYDDPGNTGTGPNRIRVNGVDKAMPGTLFRGRAIVEYGGYTYIFGDKPTIGQIMRWDGSNVTLAKQWTGISGGTCTHAVVGPNNILYFLWSDNSETVTLGTFDGTTWNVTTNTFVFADRMLTHARGLYFYNGRVVVVLFDSISQNRIIASSDGTDITSWTIEGEILAPIDVGCVIGGGNEVGQLVIIDGKLHQRLPGQSEWGQEVALPAGVRLKANRPFVTKARKGSLILSIINGRYSPGLVFVQGVPYKLGIEAPTDAPTLGANGTGLTGTTIGYYTAVHKVLVRGSYVDVHESNPSPSASITLANEGIRWTLPATWEDRVTHFRLYRVPISGSILAWKVADVAIGTTVYDEATTDAVLLSSTSLPTTLDADGQVVLDDTVRGEPPYALACFSYNARVWYGPDPNFPARMWKSRLNEPESVDLATGFVTTQTGDAITAAGTTENELVIFTAFGGFGLEGFSDSGDGDALRMRKMDNSLGCVGLYSVKNVQGLLVFLSPQGPAIYPGWRVLIHKSLRKWFDTEYLANPRAYQLAYSYTSSQKGVYSLYVIKDASPRTYVWNWFYRPMVHDGQEPDYWWYFHKYGRVISTVGDLYDPNLMRAVPHYGTCEGYVMTEDATNANDTGDTYSKALTITPRHFFPGDQGGDDAHGASWLTTELYLKNETTDVTLSAYAGDDTATLAASPQKTVTLKAAQETRAGHTAVPRTSRAETLDISGKGITISLTASSPVGIEFRGFGLLWREGEQDRPLQ